MNFVATVKDYKIPKHGQYLFDCTMFVKWKQYNHSNMQVFNYAPINILPLPFNLLRYAIFIMISAIFFLSCKKDSFITSADANLYTSADTLFFDTVFTSSGSVTQSFKIFNNNDQKLRLSKVKLSGGNVSAFKINIDGMAANEANNLEIKANDSMYVFVQVNVDPTSSTLPFIISDSIQIDYNGNTHFVQLQAYGQNAVFLNKVTLSGNVTWNNTLPYVILGGIKIDTTATLKISAGTKIYLHADAPFLVNGTMTVTGTKNDPVVFSDDRMDMDYKDLPASWPGIYFSGSSRDNVMQYAIVKNAYQGIIAQELSATSNPKLTLSQCIIDNIYDAGIYGINTEIYADNCLISNSGSNVLLSLGGDYRFVNCTVATYGSLYINHTKPVLLVSDHFSQGGVNYTAPLQAFFQNCIFWGDNGNVDNEIAIERKGNDPFSIVFDHVIYKVKEDPVNATFTSSLKNISPAFDSINTSKNIYNFRFTKNTLAPAVDAGILTSFLYDLDGKPRDAMPDIGCYER